MKVLNSFMKVLRLILLFFAMLLLIDISWIVYEVLRFGESTADPFHLAIAITLSLSLVVNIILYKSIKGWWREGSR